MTLYDLMENINLQGDIRLSVWDDDDEEIAVCEIRECQGLDCYELDKAGYGLDVNGNCVRYVDWNMYEVKYMFCGGDGYLHIELAKS